MSAVRSSPIIVALACSLLTLVIIPTAEPDHSPDRYDARQYLSAAINLHQSGVFTEGDASISGSTTGREPGYAGFLAGLMFFDKELASISLDCLRSAAGCGPEHYRFAVAWNRVFIAFSGVLIFLSVFRLTENRFIPAAMSGLYIWFNFETQKFAGYVISDSLAMLLSATVIWSIIQAGHLGSWLWWVLSGFAMALLVLTKAIFVYFILLAAPLIFLVALTSNVRRRSMLPKVLVCFLCCSLPLSAWVARNIAVDDLWGITDGRNEIVLSVREIYNDITFTEYSAGIIYWTRIKGDGLAHLLFSKDTIGKLRHDTSDGFFQRGHQRFSELVDRKKKTNNLSHEAASEEVYNEIVERILKRPFRHFSTTVLLAYRGIWIDQFAPFGILAALFVIISTIKRGRYVVLLALGPSLFAFIVYPLVSLNVPRYQMVTIPAFALVSGLFFPMVQEVVKGAHGRWLSRKILRQKDG